MKVFVLLFVFSFSSIAAEKPGPDQIAFKKAAVALYKIYQKGMKKVVRKYNSKRNNPTKSIKKSLGKFNFDFPVKLTSVPEATFENDIFEINKIGLRYDFKNFVEGSFSLAGKKYDLSCEIASECFYQFLSEYKAIEASSISWFISEAHANDNLHQLLERDYLVLGAMILANDQMEDVGPWYTSDATQLRRKDANLNLLFTSIRAENEKCQKQMEEFDSDRRWGGPYLHDPSPTDSTFKIMQQLANFESNDDFQEKVEKYLGENTAAFTDGSGLHNEKSWQEFLTCDKIMLAVSSADERGDTVPRFCLEGTTARTRCTVRSHEMAVASQNYANYCENYEALKSCIKEYYTAIEELEQSSRFIDAYQREADNLQESIDNSGALQD